MTQRWCAWHQPAPLLLEEIDDGKPEILRTDTICAACTERLLAEEQARKAYSELARMTLDGRATLVTPRARP
jgi:hypothetical protein